MGDKNAQDLRDLLASDADAGTKAIGIEKFHLMAGEDHHDRRATEATNFKDLINKLIG